MNIRKLKSSERVPMDLLLTADPSRSIVEGYLSRAECYVVEVARQIVGVYVLLPTRPNTVELVNIAVLETFQNQGIGKLLVRHALQTAKDQGYRTMEVGTGNSSVAQLLLYQKCGFRIVGVDRGFFIKHYRRKIYENGIQCLDMIRLSQELGEVWDNEEDRFEGD